MKKILVFLLMFAFVFGLVGCKKDDEGSKKGGESSLANPAETKLLSGYTSLDNKNANGAIDADGYYNIAGQKFKTVDTFRTIYQTEITDAKLNYLINSWTYNSEHYTNMVDGLVENDKYSNIVGALAKGYKTVENADGTETWYFQLKEGVKWVKNDTGEFYSEVVAQNFVDGIKYVLNPVNASNTASIVYGVVNNAKAYYDSLVPAKEDEEAKEPVDFDTVGVKAESKYVVSYTLSRPTPYFLSSLTYSPFLPVDGEFLDEMGTDFGQTENNILVNGAFRMTTHTATTLIVYTKNAKYYDAEHVYVNTVEKKFYDAAITTPTTTREWFEAGYTDTFNVNADDEAGYAKYVTGTDNKGTVKNPASPQCNGVLAVGDATYIGYFNFARTCYEYNEESLRKTADQKAATNKALLNVNFRKGVLYGLDVMKYLVRYNPTEPEQWLMRGYTNRELCAAANKDYADYVDAVFNEKQGTTGVSLAGITNGSDPVFDAEKATEYFAEAKKELLAAGLTEADFPIQIDCIGNMNVTTRAYEEAMYAPLNAAGAGVIECVLNIPSSSDENTRWGSVDNNYDFSLWSGWGPDYADPQTFLHTMCYDGDMVEQLGFITGSSTENDALQHTVLDDYTALYNKAAAIVDATKTVERYEAFAEAEYALIYEYAIIIPWLTQSGYNAAVAKTVPFQAGRATYGLTSDKLKNVVVTDAAITKDQRAAVVAAYNAGK